MKCFTSSRVGIDGCAPERVTAMAAAVLAKLSASRSISFFAQTTANAPQKVSPAAIVSIAFTLQPGSWMVSLAFFMYAPWLPSVITTLLVPALSYVSAISSRLLSV